MTNTFPVFFSKLNRTSGHVNMPGGCALSAHGAEKLIVKTDRQTDQNWIRHLFKIVCILITGMELVSKHLILFNFTAVYS
jgi:hypothetical protein